MTGPVNTKAFSRRFSPAALDCKEGKMKDMGYLYRFAIEVPWAGDVRVITKPSPATSSDDSTHTPEAGAETAGAAEDSEPRS